jgi:hypothetical protein
MSGRRNLGAVTAPARVAAPGGSRARTQSAFTLFEVAISLALITFGIASVSLLYPNGIKAVQNSRFQIYASAKALDMIDAYNGAPTAEPSLETEAPCPWDVSSGRSNTAFDLERRLSSYHFGILPLPLTIAQRIDSDADEIQGLISQGGCLYYSQPMATSGFMETGVSPPPSNEAQRLVFSVEGYAQSNAITVFPWKAWPYYYPFPSPPAHGTHIYEPSFSEPADALLTKPGASPALFQQTQDGSKQGVLWEDSFDPDMRVVFYSQLNGKGYGYRDHWANAQYGKGGSGAFAGDGNLHDSAIRYCQAALWYAARKGLSMHEYDTTTPVPALSVPQPLNEEATWKRVQAFRFLAHATACLSNFVAKDAATASTQNPPATENLTAGVVIQGLDLGAGSHPPVGGTLPQNFTVTNDKIVALHESCMNLAMSFASSYPYDWAVPRPLERTIMMDHPLIEYDLFSSPLSGTIYQSGTSSAGAQSAQQWRPLPAQPIQHIGTSFQYSNMGVPSSDPAWSWWGGGSAPAAPPYAPGQPAEFWGNPDHFTLTHPFSPDERCRQLVFWAVDWQSYEDFETAPSAPVDAARYPRGAPRLNYNPGSASSGPPATFYQLLSMPNFYDWQQYAHRNPEKVMAFISASTSLPTGSSVSGMIVGAEPGANTSADQYGRNPAALSIFSGLYGADRNFNGRLDRGPVPRSVRLHAQTVARFNFYDLRLPAAIR